MDTLPTIEVKPVYGYGWLVAGKPRREVPAVFTMSLERSQPMLWTGIVLSDGHEFEGRRVTLTQRHLEWSGYVNIAVDADRPTSRSGQLTGLPSPPER
jgi:hypothetical protein